MSFSRTNPSRFEILRELGSGGAGAVYLADDRLEGRRVALKFLSDSGAASAATFFQEEVRLLSRLSHPNLVKIFDYYPHGEGLCAGVYTPGPFYSMEVVAGLALDALEPATTPARWIELFVELCQGLHYLHRQNILHRDLKPSHVLVPQFGPLKVLDFGLAAFKSEADDKGTLGTLAYLAPETFDGDYDVVSDLFSLGVLFYQALTGRLPYHTVLTPAGLAAAKAPAPLQEIRRDLPDYFCELIHRLLALSPSQRPNSAATLIQYLNQHLEISIPLVEEKGSSWVLEKFPLVGRARELQDIFSSLPGRFVVTGPTGIGRSRLLEEIKWKSQLAGIPFYLISASVSWRLDLARRMGLLRFEGESPPPLEMMTRIYQGRNAFLAFADLQDWPEAALMELALFLKVSAQSPVSVLLEFVGDRRTRRLENFLSQMEGLGGIKTIDLNYLSVSEGEELVACADVGGAIAPQKRKEIVSRSGGIPLLLLEAARLALEGGTWAVPQSLAEATAFRLAALTEGAKDLLAALTVHVEPVEVETAAKLGLEPMEGAILELDRHGFLRPRDPLHPKLSLYSESFKALYLSALEPERIRQARSRWIRFYLEKLGQEPQPSAEAAWLTEHALANEDFSLARKWGYAGGEHYSRQGQEESALKIYQALLSRAETPLDRCFASAYLAPIYLRMGRFAEALEAYQKWYEDREDDESRVQKAKLHLFIGQVYEAWGKLEVARENFLHCLKTGDNRRFPALRPFHARGHIRMGGLEQKVKEFDSAREHFLAARGLSEGFPLGMGEIEFYLGGLERAALNFDAAQTHYRKALEHYREAKNPQGEAQASHSLALVYRELGRLSEARSWVERSLALAQQGGDYLQIARYQVNEALIEMDAARYGKALQGMEAALPVLETMGTESDRLLWKLHRLALAQFLGNRDRQMKLLAGITEAETALTRQGLKGWLRLTQAEGALLSGDVAAVFDRLQELEAESGFDPESVEGAEALLLRARAEARTGGLSSTTAQRTAARLEASALTKFRIWRDLFAFLCLPSSERREADLLPLLRAIKAEERPEWQLEIYALLRREFTQCGLIHLAHSLQMKAVEAWRQIFQSLPEELKMDFEKNRSLEKIDATLQELAAAVPVRSEAGLSAQGRPRDVGSWISESKFRQLSEIILQIAKKSELGEILDRVIDAAIELTGAERGFVLLRSEAGGPQALRGFEIATARHLNRGALAEEAFQFSLSAVRRAVEQGSILLTDNAQADERLREQKSVVQYQLTSILVCPLEIDGKVLGAIYLDHRFQPRCFSEEHVAVLSTFAAQAALAIERASMIRELREAREKLETQVRVQAKDLEQLRHELARPREDLKFEYAEIVGKAPAMMEVFRLLDHVTETNIPVWIWGESGSGKELVARSLHYNSPRKAGPLVTENVAAIPETLLESELFGHKKGAFTHADRDRIGLFEQANGGTLFLDEIGDMPAAMQAKLLRVLQEKEIRPLGSNKKIKVDVRLVTASHRDLARMVREGKFRQDLFFRINGLTLPVPPLRERREDIPLLAEHLLKKAAREHGLPLSEVSPEAFILLMKQDWPGNIRELEGVLRNALLFARGKTITPEYLQFTGLKAESSPAASAGDAAPLAFPKRETAEELEKIVMALKKYGLDKKKAADELGFSLRTLYSRLEAHGVPTRKGALLKYLGI